jgi:hypothetical protein
LSQEQAEAHNEELEQAAWRQRKVFLKAQAGIPRLLHGRPLKYEDREDRVVGWVVDIKKKE